MASACAVSLAAQVTSTRSQARPAVTSSAVTTPPACSTARVISLTARPRDATSSRTVIEYETLGAIATSVPAFPGSRLSPFAGLQGKARTAYPEDVSTESALSAAPDEADGTPKLTLAAGADGPVAGADGPVAAADGPVAGADGPVAGADGPVAAADGPVAGADGPVAGADGPVAGADGPVAGADGPVAGADGPQIDVTRLRVALARLSRRLRLARAGRADPHAARGARHGREFRADPARRPGGRRGNRAFYAHPAGDGARGQRLRPPGRRPE